MAAELRKIALAHARPEGDADDPGDAAGDGLPWHIIARCKEIVLEDLPGPPRDVPAGT